MSKQAENKELAELKSKHGIVYTLTVPLSDEGAKTATVYLKEIDRTIYASVSKIIAKDEMLGIESMIKSLWVGGDQVTLITENFYALRSAEVALRSITSTKESTLKKN